MGSLVGVHGVFNYRGVTDPSTAAREIAAKWREALGEAIGAMPFSAAYYAHLLRKPGHQADGYSLDDLSPEAEAMVRAWLNAWGLDPGVPQGIGTMPLRQAIGILAERVGSAPAAVERLVAVFFPEVDRYLRGNTPHRTTIRAEVASAIAAAERPRIVLAHSLGSVVAYEALSAYPHIEVELLVTLGSPLAMPIVVFDRLDPAQRGGFGRRPAGVRRWINITDRGDLVAIPKGGIKARFQDVDDDLETSVHWADFHTVGNYLQTEALARILRPHLPAG
ncbi:MAG TPA: hypothetical protein VFC19_27895 [Candidatus Limnocylindrales bacterium]|nr:hypothetical protein [Candidatus Limnocylindrales bacterium]